jgi:hypothetical protein
MSLSTVGSRWKAHPFKRVHDLIDLSQRESPKLPEEKIERSDDLINRETFGGIIFKMTKSTSLSLKLWKDLKKIKC